MFSPAEVGGRRAETTGTTVNIGNFAVAVLQLKAMPAAEPRRRYMMLRG